MFLATKIISYVQATVFKLRSSLQNLGCLQQTERSTSPKGPPLRFLLNLLTKFVFLMFSAEVKRFSIPKCARSRYFLEL